MMPRRGTSRSGPETASSPRGHVARHRSPCVSVGRFRAFSGTIRAHWTQRETHNTSNHKGYRLPDRCLQGLDAAARGPS